MRSGLCRCFSSYQPSDGVDSCPRRGELILRTTPLQWEIVFCGVRGWLAGIPHCVSKAMTLRRVAHIQYNIGRACVEEMIYSLILFWGHAVNLNPQSVNLPLACTQLNPAPGDAPFFRHVRISRAMWSQPTCLSPLILLT